MVDFIPEAQTLFMVVQGIVFGIPEKSTACLVGACPMPALTTLPRNTSSMSEELGSIFARASAALIAWVAICGAFNEAKAP